MKHPCSCMIVTKISSRVIQKVRQTSCLRLKSLKVKLFFSQSDISEEKKMHSVAFSTVGYSWPQATAINASSYILNTERARLATGSDSQFMFTKGGDVTAQRVVLEAANTAKGIWGKTGEKRQRGDLSLLSVAVKKHSDHKLLGAEIGHVAYSLQFIN